MSPMVADVRVAKLRMPELSVGIVQDGAPQMWNLLRSVLDAESSMDSYHEAINRYHVNERLGKVLKATEVNPQLRTERLREWNIGFDKDDTTIEHIEAYIQEMRRFHEGSDLEVLLENLTFIADNGDRIRYASLVAAGLPVGRGATEGGVQVRRVRPRGTRWAAVAQRGRIGRAHPTRHS